MPGPALEILQRFRTAESDRRYVALLDLMADDVIVCDPFFGTHHGRAEVATHLEWLEEYASKVLAPFTSWHVEADTWCGWADWEMIARTEEGKSVAIPGQSLYRLRDGLVTYWASFVDTRPLRRVTGDNVPRADHAASLGISMSSEHPRGSAHEVISQYWDIQNSGRFAELTPLFSSDAQFASPITGIVTGTAEIADFLQRMEIEFPVIGGHAQLIEIAADDNVAWAQWWYRLPTGDVPCWTVFTLRRGEITYARDMFDMAVVRELTTPRVS